MSRYALIALAPALFTLAACGGSKTPPADSASAAAPALQASQMPRPDTMKADTTKQASDSTAKGTAAKSSASGTKAPQDYDRAIRPKATIDEKTGKVVPIKRP